MLTLPEENGPLLKVFVREDAIKGGAPSLAPGKSAGLSMSPPLTIPLDGTLIASDPELAAFWNGQKAEFDFDYVTFRCDFAPDEGSPIEKAWIRVKLQTPGNSAAAPIIWSMSPFRDEDLGKATSSAKLGGDFKMFKSEIGTTTETPVKKWFVLARGEQQPEASWEFKDNGTRHIEGPFRMSLVIRRPRGQRVDGRLDGGMVIARRAFLFFTERNEAEANAAQFSLS